MKTYPFGWDFGNTETCAVLVKQGKQLRCSIPTAFVRVDDAAMESLSPEEQALLEKNAGGKATKGGKAAKGKATIEPVAVKAATDDERPAPLEPDKIIIRFRDESLSYAFGNYALEQTAQTWNGRYDPLRYASRYAARGMAAAAGLLIPDKEFGLYAVAGLPAKLYIEQPELRQQIKESLDGVYTFTLDGGVSWRTMTVEIATVVMEGAGALLAYPGISRNTDAGVIDIGGATTDLYAQHGATPLTEYCTGKDLAVENATQLLKKTFAKRYKKRELMDKEARDIMRAFASGKKANYPQEISSFGTIVPVEDLQDMAEEAVKAIAEDIASYIVQTWKDGIGRFKPIILIGGGTYYFYDAVKNRIDHVVEHEDPTFANPIGYSTLAAKKLLSKQQATVASQATGD